MNHGLKMVPSLSVCTSHGNLAISGGSQSREDETKPTQTTAAHFIELLHLNVLLNVNNGSIKCAAVVWVGFVSSSLNGFPPEITRFPCDVHTFNDGTLFKPWFIHTAKGKLTLKEQLPFLLNIQLPNRFTFLAKAFKTFSPLHVEVNCILFTRFPFEHCFVSPNSHWFIHGCKNKSIHFLFNCGKILIHEMIKVSHGMECFHFEAILVKFHINDTLHHLLCRRKSPKKVEMSHGFAAHKESIIDHERIFIEFSIQYRTFVGFLAESQFHFNHIKCAIDQHAHIFAFKCCSDQHVSLTIRLLTDNIFTSLECWEVLVLN